MTHPHQPKPASRKIELTSRPTHAQLARNVHIPLPIDPPLPHLRLVLTNSPHLLLIALPNRPAVHTLDFLARLGLRPLLEAIGMDVVAARGAAEDDLFPPWNKRRKANGAVAFDGFAV